MLFRMLGAHRYSPRGRNPAPLGQQEFQKNRQETYADRQYSPKQALPRSGNGVGLNLMGGRPVVLRPCGNLTGSERFDLSPSDECQQGLVVRVVDKNVFQAVAIGVLEHGSQ